MSLVYVSSDIVFSEAVALLNDVSAVIPEAPVPVLFRDLGSPLPLWPVDRPVFEIDESELPW